MFSPFATRACIDLVVVDDEIAERRERFEFSLKRTTDLDRRITVDPSPGEIFIEDNDGINFTSSSPASVNDAVICSLCSLSSGGYCYSGCDNNDNIPSQEGKKDCPSRVSFVYNIYFSLQPTNTFTDTMALNTTMSILVIKLYQIVYNI